MHGMNITIPITTSRKIMITLRVKVMLMKMDMNVMMTPLFIGQAEQRANP